MFLIELSTFLLPWAHLIFFKHLKDLPSFDWER